ncbi:hypothetical protein N0V93_003902 [Gnomoniopsis smithogilvyi]|uniref:Calcineurin-like phosphoesterase domain-containing protein n=1 Tax=Gnomoniopsis smithogilvyi TaxID=1191159 RepID=A0A9W8Z041_9PEZI|nr:hypothetical protein N0V93_003902 [Gnomoniopsis smithogilvyi]
MASIQILSDLHLEISRSYEFFEIEPKAPILALLGDIGTIEKHKDECLAFLTRQLRQFTTVLFVPGNHEAYHSNWPATIAILQAFEGEVRSDPSLGNFVLLDRKTYLVPNIDVAILGCSLFSLVPPERQMEVYQGLNDFYLTGEWDVDAHNEAHQRDLAWLNAQVIELEQRIDVEKVIILTHWSPSQDPRAIDSRHTGSSISSAFSTDLSGEPCFTSNKVKAWAFGHTHYNCDFHATTQQRRTPLRILTNQRGYAFAQANGFDGGKTVDL